MRVPAGHLVDDQVSRDLAIGIRKSLGCSRGLVRGTCSTQGRVVQVPR